LDGKREAIVLGGNKGDRLSHNLKLSYIRTRALRNKK
jgi:hypothetical protein